MLKTLKVFAAILSLISMAACGTSSKDKDGVNGGSPVFYGLAIVKPTKGNRTQGQVWFSEGFGKVKVEVEISGLDANTKHGFHIHEFGDCTAADGSSAGGHYNPEGELHGGIETEKRHIGDLGNLEADKRGNAKVSFEVQDMSVGGSVHPILGRAIVVHKNPDDMASQPAGGAGSRIACGVIGAATR